MASRKITQLRDRVKSFSDRLPIEVLNIVRDNEAYVVDLNSENQLFEQGINSMGTPLSDYSPYKELTIEIKKLKGQPYNRVTLRDEGDFARSFYLEIGADYFEIKASDKKTSELIRKYGRHILGLTPDNLRIVIWDYIYPDLLEIAKKTIYGTI